MRRPRMLVIAAALVGLLIVPAASSSGGGTERPFHATLVGSVHWESPGVSPSKCEIVTTFGNATGQATHLGRVTWTSSHCPEMPDYSWDGRMTFVAANGDYLYAEYDYQPGSAEVNPVIVTGGTGRFSAATGTLTVIPWVIPVFWPMPPCDPNTDPMGCVNVTVPWQAGWSISGTLSY